MRKTLFRSAVTGFVLLFSVGAARAQLGQSKEYIEPPGWSLGMNIGLADLWADVGTKSVIDHYGNNKYWKQPKFMGGIFIRYSAHPAFALRLGGNFGTLYATDEWNETKARAADNLEDDAVQRYMRNQNVRTLIWETNLLMEITPRRFNYESRGAARRFQPYLLLGVGFFHFKPTTKFYDRTGKDYGYVNLHDYYLEGMGVPSEIYPDAPKKYSLWQLAVPAGLGVKWDIGRRMAFGFEWLYRLTFTDYLDDVSGKYVDPSLYNTYLSPEKAALAADLQDRSWQIDPGFRHKAGENRGNASNKDSYSTFGVTLIFKVPTKKIPWWF